MIVRGPDAPLRWKKATKTKSIKVKPLSQIINDSSLFNKLLLDTIEGVQPLRAGSLVCLGIAGEVWPQTKEALLKKYTITDIDTESGWIVCTPKPENVVNAWQVATGEEKFVVRGQWGEKQPDGSYYQYGRGGDYILQSTSDPNDMWIVARNIFESTYEFI